MTPRPIITRSLVGLNVVAFLATALLGVSVIEPSAGELLRWGADFGPRTLTAQPWRLFTSTFLHFGIVHLALNMWCLWALGALAEPLFGWAAFLLLYLVSGLGASVASMLVHPMVVSAGASGAIFGVAGGLISQLKLRHDGLKLPVPRSALGSVVAFVGYNLLFSLTRPNVDIAGHVGGLLVGLWLGALLQRGSGTEPTRLSLPSAAAALGVALVIGYGAHAARRLHPAVALLGRAERDLAAGAPDRTNRAIQELDSALAHDSGLVAAHELLARAYGQGGRWGEALAALDRAITRTADDPELLFERGNAHLELGHIDQAIADYVAVLRLAPRAAAVHYNLGIAYARRGDVDSARAAFERALENSGNDDSLRLQARLAVARFGGTPLPTSRAERTGEPAPLPAEGDARLLADLRRQLAQARDSLESGRYAGATGTLRAVERGARGLAARYPDNRELPQLVAESRRWLARVQEACQAERIVAERRRATAPDCQ